MANRKRKGKGPHDKRRSGPRSPAAAGRPPAEARQARAAAAGPRAEGGQARSAARRRARRRARTNARNAVFGVLAIIAAMAVVFLTRSSSSNPQGDHPASNAAVQAAQSVPAATLEKVGVVQGWKPNLLPTGTPPVTLDGKPVVLYFGAEYCPYCAAERWPVVVALSRFGSFSNLKTTTSSSTDVFPDTPTFTFVGSSYTSDYLTLSSVETQDRQGNTLQTPTGLQQSLFQTYNTSSITGSDGAIPFVMVGNRFAWAGTSFDPGVLQGKTFDQIANSLSDPGSALAKAIGGSANEITAAICAVTGDQPSSVCSGATIQQAEAALPRP